MIIWRVSILGNVQRGSIITILSAMIVIIPVGPVLLQITAHRAELLQMVANIIISLCFFIIPHVCTLALRKLCKVEYTA